MFFPLFAGKTIKIDTSTKKTWNFIEQDVRDNDVSSKKSLCTKR